VAVRRVGALGRPGALRAVALFAAALLAAALPPAARGQGPALPFESLSLDEGLSDYVVMALARDAVGFLWVGTQSGLNRYDGVRFRVFSEGEASGLGSDYVTALAPDPLVAGGLWAAMGDGGLYRYDPAAERFERHPIHTGGLPPPRISAIVPEAGGALWIGTTVAGLYRYDPASGEATPFRHVPGLPSSLPSDTVRAVLATSAGTLWVGTPGGLSRYDPGAGAFVHHPLPTPHHQGGVTTLAEAEGAIWAGTPAGRLLRFQPETGRFVPYRVTPAGSVWALYPSRARPGRIWVGTRGGGLRLFDAASGAVEPVPSPLGPPERGDVLSLYEDREAVLWVGSPGGLHRAHTLGPRFEPIRHDPEASGGLSAPAVMGLYEAPSEPGVLWVGTQRGGLNRLDRRTGDVRHLFDEPGDPLNLVFALHEDPEGNLWAGGASSAIYLVDRAAGTHTAHPLPSGAGVVLALYAPPSAPEEVWVATQGAGLHRFDPRRRAVTASYLDGTHVWSVAEAPSSPGVLWVATHGGGLHRLDAVTGAVEPVRPEGCEAAERVVSLAPGPGDVLWLGTFDRGLFRYDRLAGACRQFTRGDGLAWDDVGSIHLDERGRLWMPSSNGLSLYDPASGVFTRFTREDGLQDNVFHYAAHARLSDGSLALGGANGLNVFHPLRVRVDTEPPPMVLTRLLINGRPHTLERDGRGGFRPLRLPFNANDLQFEYAALDLRQPGKNAYRVRLEGAEAAWRPVGPETTARYPFLPPGRYTFHVVGASRDGYWAEAGVAVPFHIRPPWWRTWTFWTLLGLAALGLVAGAYQYRIRQILRLERTRRRIADDLHDDIGSKISTVALRLDLVGRSPGITEAERRQIEELAGSARRVVDELRDAIWIVDAAHDDLPALVARMEQFAEQMLRGRSWTFHAPTDLPPVALPMEARRHLYLLFKEALHNAVRHGQPEHVDIRLACAAGRLSLTLADDGAGFDPAEVRRGRGLTTLASRAEALGGDLSLDSAPGRGTVLRLELTLP
jgi:signal transduction histidine kinase/ligand-binding sensor domain-containing protein